MIQEQTEAQALLSKWLIRKQTLKSCLEIKDSKEGVMRKVKGKFKSLACKAESRFDRFRKGRKGMELLQLAIVVVIAVGLIGVVAFLASNVGNQIESAADEVATFTGWDYYNNNGGKH